MTLWSTIRTNGPSIHTGKAWQPLIFTGRLIKHLIKNLRRRFDRYQYFQSLLDNIEGTEPGGLDAFARSYETYGVHATPDGGVYCKEWCPGARGIYIWGDFSEHRVIGAATGGPVPCFLNGIDRGMCAKPLRFFLGVVFLGGWVGGFGVG